jgi:hypothetical protein
MNLLDLALWMFGTIGVFCVGIGIAYAITIGRSDWK